MTIFTPYQSKLTAILFALCSFSVYSQSLSEQYKAQEQANKIKKLRDADKQAISQKNNPPPITIADLVDRGLRLKCDFPNRSDTDFYYRITTEDNLYKTVLIDNKTVDYRDPGVVTGELKKNGDNIQYFMLIPIGKTPTKSLVWEFDSKNNIGYMKKDGEIGKFDCTLVKFTVR